MKFPDLSELYPSGAEIAVTVTPRAARDHIEMSELGLRVRVSAAPEKGRANEAVRRILAKALGLPKSRLVLIRGQTARHKVFRID